MASPSDQRVPRIEAKRKGHVAPELGYAVRFRDLRRWSGEHLANWASQC
jgi:hypothetical protein